MSPPEGGGRGPERLLTLRSGGWVLVLAGVFALGLLGLGLVAILSGPRGQGDGRHVETYGFDLTTCLVARERLVASGAARDAVPALTDPAVLTTDGLAELARELARAHAGKLLVSTDRVVGVTQGGAARAYPLRFLAWHGIVNDTLGGRAIAVTYDPLCDSTVVFERQTADGRLEFGVSGLLCESNLLMYDRRPDGRASLWSQLQMRAVAGPAAERGATLAVCPAAVVHWSDWVARHPDTTVLKPDLGRLKLYKRTYDLYFASDTPRFPLSTQPADGRPRMMPLVIVRTAGDWHAWPLAEVLERAGLPGVPRSAATPEPFSRARELGTWRTVVDGVALRFECRPSPAAVWPMTEAGEPVETIYAFHFAWHAARQALGGRPD